jgi:hypothetical protein
LTGVLNKLNTWFNANLFFSILLHYIVQWVLQVRFPSACSLLCWISLFFTTCFGLHGHLQVCSIFYIHLLEGMCFAFFWRGHNLHVSICVSPVLFSFVTFVVSLRVCFCLFVCSVFFLIFSNRVH